MFLLLLSKFHITFAGMWLISIVAYPVLKKNILYNKNKICGKKFIQLYLVFANLFGMIGGIGILTTGIITVLLNPYYGFFQFSANPWLTTKQILMVVLLVILAAKVIPASKKIRSLTGPGFENNEPVSEDVYTNLNSLFKWNLIMNIIVLINFLLGITHYLF